MREILFHGKRLDNGEWVYGSLIDRIEGAVPAIVTLPSVDDSVRLEFEYDFVDPSTVGQYTGLKDKNGKRIFEGDVIKITWATSGRNPVHTVCSVEYSKSGFFVREKGKLCGQVSNYACAGGGVSVEVIGNIHDNPGLLEGGV